MKNLQTKKLKKSIRQGDIFALGKHHLMCGNAQNITDIKRLIGKDKVNLIITDPPYGVSLVQGKSNFSRMSVEKNIINDDITSETEYAKFTKDWLNAIIPYLSRKNTVYIFNSDKMIFALRNGMEEADIKFSQLLIWIKNHIVIGRKDYLLQHELIAYGWHGAHKFLKSKDKSVLFYPKPNKSTLHPTMKPIGLLRRLILNSTKIGDSVYDCFGGSGSTLIACEQTCRRCFIIELDPEYCQTIIDRFEKITKIKARKIYG